MTALLLLLAGVVVVASARLHRATARTLQDAERLAGPPLDPETGMLREDALELVIGADLDLVRGEGRGMSVVVCAIHAREPHLVMRAVERVRRAHEPCIRIGHNRFAIIWHDDSGPNYLSGALARLSRTILDGCTVADAGAALVQNDDAPPRALVERARAAAQPVQDFVVEQPSP